MKVQALSNFFDIEQKKSRNKGDKWECTAKRGKALIAAKKATEVKAEKKAGPKGKKEQKPKGTK